MVPSVIYAPAVRAALRSAEVHAAAHITGGGIPGNLARVLPPGLDAVVQRSAWEEPRIFAEIRRLGDVDEGEMARVFNLGIGMVLVVRHDGAEGALAALQGAGCGAVVMGQVTKGSGEVHMEARS
jgi:phosphoribosylformylglycinamidine cyclo-ligase